MALPVRPPSWPVVQPQAQPVRSDARLSAQKAFFEAALAGKVAPQSLQPEPAPASAARARAAAPTQPEAGEKIPRPGSIIDIWV